MPISKIAPPILSSVLISALPSASHAGYTWSNVTPANNGNGSGSSQNYGAIVSWNAGDTTPTGGGVDINVIGGYAGIISSSPSINIGSLRATFSGTVTFNPPLPSGAQYQIVFGLNGPNGQLAGTTTTVTVP